MARYYLEGIDASASDMAAWDQLHGEFEGEPDEHRAAQTLYRLTGAIPSLYDTHGRQNVVDILLTHPGGRRTVVEVSSTFDETLQRDMRNSRHLEREVGALYTGTGHWILHFHPGWDIPPRRARTLLATQVAAELNALSPSNTQGHLASASWIFAWRDDTQKHPGVEVRGWDSRVPQGETRRLSEHFADFLDTDTMLRKRRKLVADAKALNATARYLYLFTSPTGANAGLGSASTLALSDGVHTLPSGVDELWLDGLNGTVRRYVHELGHWTEYAV